MRHDGRMTQSNSAASRQRVGSTGSSSSSSSNNRNSNEYDEHYRSYHHGYHYRSNGINGYSTNEHGNGGTGGSGGTVSALSGNNDSHETQRQWEWLEDVLAKSQRNGETVRLPNISIFQHKIPCPENICQTSELAFDESIPLFQYPIEYFRT